MLATVSLETARSLLNTEHQEVEALLNTLTPEEMTHPDTIRHGLFWGQHWSFKDLLAHLTTYEALAIDAHASWINGERHWSLNEVETSAGSENIHNEGVANRRHLSLDAVLDEWHANQRELTAVLENLTEEQWQSPAPFETTAEHPYNLGGVFEAIIAPVTRRPIYRHLPVHIPDYAEYLRQLRSADQIKQQ